MMVGLKNAGMCSHHVWSLTRVLAHVLLLTSYMWSTEVNVVEWENLTLLHKVKYLSIKMLLFKVHDHSPTSSDIFQTSWELPSKQRNEHHISASLYWCLSPCPEYLRKENGRPAKAQLCMSRRLRVSQSIALDHTLQHQSNVNTSQLHGNNVHDDLDSLWQHLCVQRIVQSFEFNIWVKNTLQQLQSCSHTHRLKYIFNCYFHKYPLSHCHFGFQLECSQGRPGLEGWTAAIRLKAVNPTSFQTASWCWRNDQILLQVQSRSGQYCWINFGFVYEKVALFPNTRNYTSGGVSSLLVVVLLTLSMPLPTAYSTWGGQ